MSELMFEERMDRAHSSDYMVLSHLLFLLFVLTCF